MPLLLMLAALLSVLSLQVGAQVMLLKNLDLHGSADSMLVNGSCGVVIGFDSEQASAIHD